MNRELKQMIQDDIFRNTGGARRRVSLLRNNMNLRYLKAFRCYQYYRDNFFLAMLYRLRLRYLSRKSFIQIPRDTVIGRGLYIGHYGRIIISPGAVLGDNVNIATGITIGKTNRGDRMGYPVIGNKVWIGTNAVIVGKVTIGDDVLIAPNSYVNIDIPSHSIVMGNPAKIIPKTEATKDYVNNCV